LGEQCRRWLKANNGAILTDGKKRNGDDNKEEKGRKAISVKTAAVRGSVKGDVMCSVRKVHKRHSRKPGRRTWRDAKKRQGERKGGERGETARERRVEKAGAK